MRICYSLLFFSFCLSMWASQPAEVLRWEERAKKVTIIRDSWGIPHIYAKSDADAVFGMLYVQCEDDFRRVERNYLDAIGQMALAYGPSYIYHDLRARMFMDSVKAKALYAESPKWLQALCDAFADGINYYLHTHPEVKPDYINRFQPWMPFTFSEGSIGGDITRISLRGMEAFYGQDGLSYHDPSWALEEAPTGSNGFAISPEKSQSGDALLLINPHTSFYFRSEMQVNSEEGLKAYGAVTWGQFFIYQGFNEKCGWMHTSTYADAIDQYKETIEKGEDRYFYKYGDIWRQVREEKVQIPYQENGEIKHKDFTIYRTHRGPIIRKEGERWISFRMMERPKDALRQSFLRTKAKGYKSFNKTMKIRTNSSNNTVYADAQGNIAYWHGNFIPKRDSDFDYNGLIDGSNPKVDWNGLHRVKETVQLRNPSSGWLQNCNATPFTVAGPNSPKRSDFANYIAPDRENFRGVNAVRVLSREQIYDLDKLIDAANDPYLAAFEKLIPDLLTALEKEGKEEDSKLKDAIQLMKKWDLNYGEESVATSIAIYWAEQLLPQLRKRLRSEDRRKLMLDQQLIKYFSPAEKVAAFEAGLDKLANDFGQWQTPWGEINRFQRLTGKIEEEYDDQKPSIPVGFTSSRWGSLASYGARTYPHTKRRYGRGGNSFVAVIEFGDRVNARAVVSGGQNNQPDSPHFLDQANLFCKGQFREVYFYREDVEKNAEEKYQPGKR